MPQSDLYSSYRYLIEIDGSIRAGFQEVSGYDASIDVVERRKGNEASALRKLPGLAKYANLTLKSGVTADLDMYHWFQDATQGRVTRKSFIIVLFDDARREVARWSVINAWPVKYESPSFQATVGEVHIGKLELSHEGMLRV